MRSTRGPNRGGGICRRAQRDPEHAPACEVPAALIGEAGFAVERSETLSTRSVRITRGPNRGGGICRRAQRDPEHAPACEVPAALIGEAGFEPAAPGSQSQCSAGLSYSPLCGQDMRVARLRRVSAYLTRSRCGSRPLPRRQAPLLIGPQPSGRLQCQRGGKAAER